jgi:hypothetical protein
MTAPCQPRFDWFFKKSQRRGEKVRLVIARWTTFELSRARHLKKAEMESTVCAGFE